MLHVEPLHLHKETPQQDRQNQDFNFAEYRKHATDVTCNRCLQHGGAEERSIKSVSPTCLVRDLQGLLSARERDKRGEKKKGKREESLGGLGQIASV